MIQPGNPPTRPSERSPGPSTFGRRRLLNGLLGLSAFTWLGSVVYPVVRYLFPPKGQEIKEQSVKLGMVGDYAKDSGTLFRIGNKPGILIRTSGGDFRAYIAICTHLDCTVQFKQDEGVVWCACHNGRYNLQGTNISGPPPRPLTPLVVSLKGDEVHVSLAT